MKSKLYKCQECGFEKQIDTNHYGECYSWGSYNACPHCPPFKLPTTWVCAEPIPDGAWVPDKWTKACIQVQIDNSDN